MGQIGDPLTPAVPSVGASGTGYASDIDTILAEVVTRLTQKVPIGSIRAGQVGETFDLNDRGLANAQYLGLYTQGNPADAPFGSLVRSSGNLYFNDTSGAVQITDGASLNAAGIGGIVGDYGGVNPAKVAFVDATSTYEFYDDQAGGLWATVKAKQLDLVDQTTSRVVHLKPSTGITGTYTLILPTALPGAGNSLLAVTSAGVMALAETAAVTNIPSIGDGVKHSDVTTWYPPSHFDWVINSGTPTRDTTSGKISAAGVFSVSFFLPAPPVGRRLKGVSVRYEMAGTLTNTLTLAANSFLDGSVTTLGNATSTTTGAPLTLTKALTTAVVADTIFRADVSFASTGVPVEYDIFAIGLVEDYV